MSDKPGDVNRHVQRRAMQVAFVAVLSAAAAGYLVGTDDQGVEGAPGTARFAARGSTQPPSPTAPQAVSYLDMASSKRGPNAQWTNDLGKLPATREDLLADVQVDDRSRTEAIDRRALRRAYDGAPPQVPHPIDQMSSSSCMACHGEGAVVAGRRAPRLSHAAYTSCTQCHVPMTPMKSAAHADLSRPLAHSGFQGLDAPRAGARAYPGAPPTLPHSTWMRNDCLSCHGPGADAGLKTTHPWRQNCLQCHAPSAQLDQHRFDGDLASFPANAEIQAWLQTLPSPAAN